MTNRWANRAELTASEGQVYWHILMYTYPQACAAAQDIQGILADFPGFHMTPHKWLHITTLLVGSTDETTPAHMSTMAAEARRILSTVAPIPITLSKILYHPEAIALRVQPSEALQPILDAAHTATRTAVGHTGKVDDHFPMWTPHMTVAYSTTEQPAQPIISALGKAVPERRIVIDSLTLVIQWGPEQQWNWQPITTTQLHGA